MDVHVETQGETGSSEVVVSTTTPSTPWQSQDVAANFGPNNVAASQTFGFAPLPPYDTQTAAQAQDEIAMDIGSAPGPLSSLEDNPDRKRIKIYDSLLAKANSSTTEHAVQGMIVMPIHSNGSTAGTIIGLRDHAYVTTPGITFFQSTSRLGACIAGVY